jgi:hypothetical protein
MCRSRGGPLILSRGGFHVREYRINLIQPWNHGDLELHEVLVNLTISKGPFAQKPLRKLCSWPAGADVAFLPSQLRRSYLYVIYGLPVTLYTLARCGSRAVAVAVAKILLTQSLTLAHPAGVDRAIFMPIRA